MEPLWPLLPLRTARGPSKALVSNKCPSLGYVPFNFLPRGQVILARRTKRLADSNQNSLALGTYWIMVQRLVTGTNQPVRRSLEHLPTAEANKCCCQLPFHARNAAGQ
jgi:hypothetical protein